jgi:single-stranded-DNA-specific exonuclease
VTKRWRMARVDSEAAAELGRALGLSPVAAGMLVRRGYGDPDGARAFLNPSLKDLPNPRSFTDMDQAVDRILTAMDNKEPIAVYGDYDADGLTATALLCILFRTLGISPVPYIPHRLEEGYGLNEKALEQLAQQGIKLVVTVDCGVSDHSAIKKARQLGMSIIITDHHQLPPSLPKADAVINPQRDGRELRILSGVGVAFFLAGGIRQALRERGNAGHEFNLAPMLSLVALGTVADVMPLTGVNRILVTMGLKHLARPPLPGLTALKKAAAVEPDRDMTARQVAFRLAPRLNAAGRMGSPQPGLDLLLTDAPDQADALASELEGLNRERRRMQAQTFKQAMAMIDPDDSGRTIVLAREGWSRGVVGLAASKLAEIYRRPSILLALEDGMAIGSGRSIAGFNLFAALSQCRDLMVRFGGHEQAAGLSIDPQNLPDLTKAFEDVAQREIDDSILIPTLEIEAEVTLDELQGGLMDELSRLAPFGTGNPEPVLALREMKVVSACAVGGQSHLKMCLSQNGRTLETIGFGLGSVLPDLGPRVRVAVTRHTSQYRGRTTHGWKIVDIQREN